MRWSLALALLAGCTQGGTGTLAVSGWGEEAPYQGFPNSELSFADGWAVSFTHSVTSIADIVLADPDTEAPVAKDQTNYVADWVNAHDPVALGELDAPAGRAKFSFSFVPLTDGATAATDVDPTVLSTMVANGWNTYLEGTATKGSTTVTFAWGMANGAQYRNCVNGEDDTDGVVIADGESTDATLFVHQDHTFWDRLGTEEAELRFDAPAAWADADGAIPFDDLAGDPIAALVARDGTALLDDGGNPLGYDDAGLGLGDLRSFIAYSTAQQGHLNGEGLCTVADL